MRQFALLAALALGSIATGAVASAPAQPSWSVADLLQTACVDTGLSREAFQGTARSQHWRPATLRSASRSGGWDVAYRAGPYTVVLSRVETEGNETDPSVGSICMVTTEHPTEDWRNELERFATDHNLTAEPPVEIPGFGAIPTWSRPGDRTMTAAYRADPGSLTVTLSRQTVVTAP